MNIIKMLVKRRLLPTSSFLLLRSMENNATQVGVSECGESVGRKLITLVFQCRPVRHGVKFELKTEHSTKYEIEILRQFKLNLAFLIS